MSAEPESTSMKGEWAMQPFRQRPRLLTNRDRMHFPADVQIQMDLAPLEPFGAANEGGRQLFGADETAPVDGRQTWDPDIGRGTVASEPDPMPLEREEPGELAYTVEGNSLRLGFECRGYQQLIESLRLVTTRVPQLLTTQLLQPVYVRATRGTAGGIPFRWIYEQDFLPFETTSPARQLRRIDWSVRTFRVLDWTSLSGLSAALHYFHVACRLLDAPPSAWEFLPEAVLNLTKTLEALFGESRDEVRESLRALGFDEAVIEGHFISIMIVRNEFDVGHIMISAGLDEAALRELTDLVYIVQSSFQELLTVIVDEVVAGGTRYTDRGRTGSHGKSGLLGSILSKAREASAAKGEVPEIKTFFPADDEAGS